jgi:hypothetical protein
MTFVLDAPVKNLIAHKLEVVQKQKKRRKTKQKKPSS